MRSGVHSALWTLFYLSVWHATNLDFGLAKQQVDSMYVIPTRPLWPTQPTLCTVYVGILVATNGTPELKVSESVQKPNQIQFGCCVAI